ncbi:hypothetical protein [Acetobacter senegalensis]|uniref:hypothetical protein n=1 Tax=Acetobacter senegalensis TaxID=446692 RepID=UPI00264FE116|nr:hypothetical protein [Acetobacter senegalensis]MDN7356267.1 hypothetical protein [Acetobacter senegalensis]
MLQVLILFTASRFFLFAYPALAHLLLPILKLPRVVNVKNFLCFLIGVLISGAACAAISLYAPSPIEYSAPRGSVAATRNNDQSQNYEIQPRSNQPAASSAK